MKPLTIEQLKALEVGDWVWITPRNEYGMISICDKYLLLYILGGTMTKLNYSDYSTTWLAYKNKEQVEGTEEIIRYNAEKEVGEWLRRNLRKNATDVHFMNYDEYGKAVSLTVAESLVLEIIQEAERCLAELKGEEK